MTLGGRGRSRGRRALVPGAVVGGLGLAFLHCLRRRQALSRRNEVLEALSQIDDLTGMYNRRHLEEHLADALASARRHGHALSILFIDIDGFKRVNDELGHQVGDSVLRIVGQRIPRALRREDVVGRWGGEEFLAVLPMTPISGALALAERLRSDIEKTPMQAGGRTVEVTVSIGCAESDESDVEALMHEADVALYQAKQGGRNRVAAFDDQGGGASSSCSTV